MKIYLASSWKMKHTVELMHLMLTEDGHEVDSFCNEDGGRVSFDWNELTDIMRKEGTNIKDMDAIDMMSHWRVKKAFEEDKKWIDWADVLIMVMPCGRSSHLEAGYAVGSGKKMYIVGGFKKGEFDVMYGFADGMYDYSDVDKLLKELKSIQVSQ
ncbi:MAG: hypothetical protein KAJ39_06365 [Gammaproteobacteria bacterium]|nr:hypothetical protein [Gammaproteobacteria bacterium]